ncbi:MAG: VPLPA-CTERM sorting domain-containing protein [Pseudomonadota bacterium]
MTIGLFRRTHAAGLALAASIAVAAPSQAATLIGDQVDIALTGGISLQDLGVLVNDDVEIQGGDASTDFGEFLFASEFIDIGADRIDLQFDLPLGSDGMLTFSDLDFGLGIGVASLTSTNAAVTQANVSTTLTSVTIDASDWFFAGGEATLSLTLTEVPLPAAGWFLLLGIGAIGFARSKHQGA